MMQLYLQPTLSELVFQSVSGVGVSGLVKRELATCLHQSGKCFQGHRVFQVNTGLLGEIGVFIHVDNAMFPHTILY